MNLNPKIAGMEVLSFVILLSLALVFIPSVKGLPPSTATTTAGGTVNTQACDCSSIEYNYTSCKNALIQTNESLNICSNITYSSVVNNINQQINNINTTIYYFYIALVIDFGISFLTLFTLLDIKFSIVKKVKKIIKKEEQEISIFTPR
jgi:hypothetical protein